MGLGLSLRFGVPVGGRKVGHRGGVSRPDRQKGGTGKGRGREGLGEEREDEEGLRRRVGSQEEVRVSRGVVSGLPVGTKFRS